MAETKVKQAREARGLSQAELARRARVSQSLLGAIERGESEPTISKAHRIARVLKFKTTELWPITATSKPDASTPRVA